MNSKHLIKLKNTIVAIHGERGDFWWRTLPKLLNDLALSHGLTLQAPFEELTFNYVLPVLGPNREAWVLKLGVPHYEFTREIHSLEHYNGEGCIRLIDANSIDGWIIMERCIPGARLVDINDKKQTIPIAVSVMQRLWRPIKNTEYFTPLAQWLESLEQLNSKELLQHLVRKSLRDFIFSRSQELLSSQGEQVLLHGDLHHYNILQHQSEWLAIDPKGIIGEREFEIGACLRNPLRVVEDPQKTKEIADNLALIIELTGFDRQRVLSWCIIQAVLCVCWYCEDKMLEKAHQLTAFAERLYSFLLI
ncbi:MAG: aminoglycoside/hydroxyurea antibiotic resistance kinase [Legionellales bacterium RIFCSPHIGHO2_12_FULL_42_9]|nr:MAG: aminoglycoside/hydroxyurea antibiotic resistance kinase [Legionellales bacterium RIFCSPHIGHO2_12_FULL_42_9]